MSSTGLQTYLTAQLEIAQKKVAVNGCNQDLVAEKELLEEIWDALISAGIKDIHSFFYKVQTQPGEVQYQYPDPTPKVSDVPA